MSIADDIAREEKPRPDPLLPLNRELVSASKPKYLIAPALPEKYSMKSELPVDVMIGGTVVVAPTAFHSMLSLLLDPS